jgi:hypothetical protein
MWEGKEEGEGGGDGRPAIDGVAAAAARREKRNPKELIQCRRE